MSTSIPSIQCTFLTGRYVVSCRAMKEVYVPSSFELEEYCTCNRHKVCPFYVGHKHDSRTELQVAGR